MAGVEGPPNRIAADCAETRRRSSFVQHPSRAWRWGRLVVVHPAGNTDFADACSRYRSLLVDQSTFSSMTLEELLDVL